MTTSPLRSLAFPVAVTAVLSIGLTIMWRSRPGETPPLNLAVESVRALDPDIICTPYYNGEGLDVVHAARCKLADKTLAYCRITVTSRKLECGPLFDLPSQKPEPPGQATGAAPAPSPVQTPSPAPSPAPSSQGKPSTEKPRTP